MRFIRVRTINRNTGDTVQFAEYVERNIRLAQIRNTYPLPPPSAAFWIRRELADSLRSRSPYAVNLLVAGYDLSVHEPKLYWIDYLGTMAPVPFAAHGYGSYFALSLLDRFVSQYLNRDQDIYTAVVGITIQRPLWRKDWQPYGDA